MWLIEVPFRKNCRKRAIIEDVKSYDILNVHFVHLRGPLPVAYYGPLLVPWRPLVTQLFWRNLKLIPLLSFMRKTLSHSQRIKILVNLISKILFLWINECAPWFGLWVCVQRKALSARVKLSGSLIGRDILNQHKWRHFYDVTYTLELQFIQKNNILELSDKFFGKKTSKICRRLLHTCFLI